MNEPALRIKYFPLFIGVILAIGVFLGMNLNTQNARKGFFKTGFSNDSKMMDIINLIDREYVDSVDEVRLYEAGINAMLENLDPHSVYIPPVNLKKIEEEMAGNFEGIGVQFRIIKDTIVVISPVKGGPSEKAGLIAGDRIVYADGDTVFGPEISTESVMTKLKGEEGTKVEVGVKRKGEGELLYFSIERGMIPTYSLDVSYMPLPDVGYIKIRKFTATTYDEFMEASKDLMTKGMKRLILDLRENPGGYLKAATSIVDEFLEADKRILYTQGKNRSKQIINSTSRSLMKEVEVIVLINENSASASEIVAGALQDNDRALIVGRRSFGKGLVSEQFPFPDGSGIRLTIARYYTPTGRCIQKPYGEGSQEYAHDFLDRYEHGELFHADSMRLDDLPKFKTPKGRIVYGGGGIIPDEFVPLDTSFSSTYYNQLLRNNMIFNYAFEYVDGNRHELSRYKTPEDFILNFNVTEKMMKGLIDYAMSNGVPYSKDDYLRSKEDIRWRLKAFVARELFEFDGFYPIWHMHDQIFNKALDHFVEKD